MSIVPPEPPSSPADPPAIPSYRWVKFDSEVSDPCGICGGPTIKPRNLKPIDRKEEQGGRARFRICPHCDKINFMPPGKKVIRRAG